MSTKRGPPIGVGWVIQGWVGHAGVGWGGSYRGGVGWVIQGWGVVSWRGRVCHGGVRWVMDGWGGVGCVMEEWGMSWRGGVGCVMQGWGGL